MTTELKPCPFCGGEAEEISQYILLDLVTWVQCKDKHCGASAKPKVWNRRASQPAPGEPVAWMVRKSDGRVTWTTDRCRSASWVRDPSKLVTPLYTHPTNAAAVEREALEEAATWLEKKAAEYYLEQGGYEDLGTISFGRGRNADFKFDWYCHLQELAEELRALRKQERTTTTAPEDAATTKER